MIDWITPGVGSALSGLFTASGALGAFYLAQRFFTGRIADLKSAISETEKTIETLNATVSSRIQGIQEMLVSLEESAGAIQETTSRTQAAVYEAQEESAFKDSGDNLSYLKEMWSQITNHLEDIASSPNVDGRKRAKYGRIDRRSYYDLIKALHSDGLLDNSYADANSATEIWYSCRRSKSAPESVIKKMTSLRDSILATPLPE